MSEQERRPGAGLRERQKQRRHQAISDAAIALFLARGFDQVSVAEIAAAVEISKPTLFRYFPTKEDLVLHRFADHEDEPARVVLAGRAEGVRPLDALLRRFLAGLESRDPVTGLNDDEGVRAYLRMLYGTPSLAAGMYSYQARSEDALATALGGGLAARLAAGQIVVVQRVLALENVRRIAAGERAAQLHPEAVAAAESAFGRLRGGLSDY
ncbi:TetR family transcriptional regulator [Streptomyces sp. 150FB]|uniref:TetR family transcriptional regulator n=1 Tax=Streptomyces sp. 150FB TaxID=1576605 RepID=UPI0005890383|nr:TetR family transcriptional regulator [Streptomyces sp. 150FB]KIF75794.1 TetR family transcriptional regulator [Streptomyces sp. 150FB]